MEDRAPEPDDRVRNDISALAAFVEAAQRMAPSEIDAALNYLNDRYGSPADQKIADRIREEFAELIRVAEMPAWNQRASIVALERACASAMRRNRLIGAA